MYSPDYNHGNHAWPSNFTLPKGHVGVGVSEGLAYIQQPDGAILTVPFTTFDIGEPSGLILGLVELWEDGIYWVEIKTTDTSGIIKR